MNPLRESTLQRITHAQEIIAVDLSELSYVNDPPVSDLLKWTEEHRLL